MFSKLMIRALVTLFMIYMCGARGQTTNSSCFDDEFVAVNATGSVQIPGLQPYNQDETMTNDTWTISTAVKEVLVPALNTSFIRQKFWLGASPTVDISAADLNYTGCAFLLQGTSQSKKPIENSDNNTCQGIFDPACYNAIVDAVTSNVSNYAYGNEPDDVCGSLTFNLNPPSECKDSQWDSIVGSPFGSPNLTAVGNSSCVNSAAQNVFNGSATQGDLLSTRSFSLPTGNQTYYLEFIDTTWPLIFTVWPKDSGAAWVPQTRMVCLRADHIAAGSVASSGGIYASQPGLAMALMSSVLVTIVAGWNVF